MGELDSLTKSLKDLDQKLEKLRLKEVKADEERKKKEVALKAQRYVKPLDKIISSKGFEINPIKTEWKFGIIPYPAFMNKNYNTLVIYIDRSYNIKFIALKENLRTVLEYMKREDYIIYNPDSYKIYHYNNKPILWLTPDFPMNMQLDLDKNKFLCDTETFHNLINNVVEYRLTKASSGLGGIGDLISKYWWVILIGAGLYIASQQPEGLKGFFGL